MRKLIQLLATMAFPLVVLSPIIYSAVMLHKESLNNETLYGRRILLGGDTVVVTGHCSDGFTLSNGSLADKAFIEANLIDEDK